MRRFLALLLIVFISGCYHVRSTVRTPTTAYDSWGAGVGTPAPTAPGSYGYGYAPAVAYPVYRVPMWGVPPGSWSTAPVAPAVPASPTAGPVSVPPASASTDGGDARIKTLEEKVDRAAKTGRDALDLLKKHIKGGSK